MENENKDPLNDEKKQLKVLIHEMIQKGDFKIPDEEKAKYEDIFVKIFCDKQRPRDVLGFSVDMMEYIYSYGYRLYNLGKYKDAGHVFTSLTIYDPYEARYALALGASQHRQNNLNEASQNYFRAGYLNPKDPLPFFYLYDCYMKGGILSDALFCLEEALKRMGDNPVFTKMKEKSLLYLNALQQQIEELRKKGELVPLDEKDPLEELPPEIQKMVEKELKERKEKLNGAQEVRVVKEIKK